MNLVFTVIFLARNNYSILFQTNSTNFFKFRIIDFFQSFQQIIFELQFPQSHNTRNMSPNMRSLRLFPFQFFLSELKILFVDIIQHDNRLDNLIILIFLSNSIFSGLFIVINIMLYEEVVIDTKLGLFHCSSFTRTKRTKQHSTTFLIFFTNVTNPISFRNYLYRVTILMNRNIAH